MSSSSGSSTTSISTGASGMQMLGISTTTLLVTIIAFTVCTSVRSSWRRGRRRQEQAQAAAERSQHERNINPNVVPMPLEDQEALPKRIYSQDASKAAELTCAICLTEFDSGEVLIDLPCSHSFHSPCISLWFNLHSTCPTCRLCLLPKPEPGSEAEAQDGIPRVPELGGAPSDDSTDASQSEHVAPAHANDNAGTPRVQEEGSGEVAVSIEPFQPQETEANPNAGTPGVHGETLDKSGSCSVEAAAGVEGRCYAGVQDAGEGGGAEASLPCVGSPLHQASQEDPEREEAQTQCIVSLGCGHELSAGVMGAVHQGTDGTDGTEGTQGDGVPHVCSGLGMGEGAWSEVVNVERHETAKEDGHVCLVVLPNDDASLVPHVCATREEKGRLEAAETL